jgi:hypothetical protein
VKIRAAIFHMLCRENRWNGQALNASATALVFSGTSQSLVMNIPMDAKQDRGSVPSS